MTPNSTHYYRSLRKSCRKPASQHREPLKSTYNVTEQNYSNLVLIVDSEDRYPSGWISDENGVALKKAMVTLDTTLGDGAVEFFSYRSQTTDRSGRFSFDRVAAGEHRISIYANGSICTNPYIRQASSPIKYISV